MVKWHNADPLNRMYLNVGDGKKAAMPRYYKDRIYDRDTRSEIAGFYKGEIEQQLLLQDLTWSTEDHIAYQEAVKAAFRNMYTESKRNRQKI